jgi:glycosyltransferase involved in cell wall biosynthesis
MDISAIIPTRNRSRLLNRTLNSIANQTLAAKRFEVIVVDNGSTDATAAICASWQQRMPGLRRIVENRPGLHNARHAGMQAARSELIVYADDDIRAFPSWLEGMTEALADPKVGLVGGNNIPEFESEPPSWWNLLKDPTPWGWAVPALSVLDFGDSPRSIPPGFIWGCNFGVRKRLLVEVEGFHPDGMPTDNLHKRGDGESYVASEIVRKGYRASFEPKASVHHLVVDKRLTADYFQQRGFAQGISKVYSEIRRKSALSAVCRARLLAIRLRAWGRGATQSRCLPRKKLLLGYAAGIKAHVQRCVCEPELLDWINRPNYLD